MKEKYEACILLHALGDTIGYKNGQWEFNNAQDMTSQQWAYVNEMLYEFIELGGINNINLDGWKYSDDTILHSMIASSVKEKFNDDPIKISDYFAYILKENGLHDLQGRHAGRITKHAIRILMEGKDWKTLPYREMAGGSGASMRTPVLGLIYSGKKNRKKLIQIALETSRVTHNNTIGYLGGITSALFTAFAIENIPVNTWAKKLIEILESGIIEEYLEQTRGIKEYIKDKDIFINKWKKYIDEKFTENDQVIYNKSMRNLVYRTKYYYDNYGYHKSPEYFPGSGGDDSVIIAYDCLIDAGKSWDKLVVYSMIHVGDSDTTGAIAGALYGALYGLSNVPSKNLKYLEDKKKILKIVDHVYNIKK